jgi:hypothetical protein
MTTIDSTKIKSVGNPGKKGFLELDSRDKWHVYQNRPGFLNLVAP